jgi:hypothetical protein
MKGERGACSSVVHTQPHQVHEIHVCSLAPTTLRWALLASWTARKSRWNSAPLNVHLGTDSKWPGGPPLEAAALPPPQPGRRCCGRRGDAAAAAGETLLLRNRHQRRRYRGRGPWTWRLPDHGWQPLILSNKKLNSSLDSLEEDKNGKPIVSPNLGLSSSLSMNSLVSCDCRKCPPWRKASRAGQRFNSHA